MEPRVEALVGVGRSGKREDPVNGAEPELEG